MQFREIHNMSFFLFYLTKTKKTTRFFLSPDITITDKRYRGPSPEKTPEISAERNATKDSRGGGGGEESLPSYQKPCMYVCVCTSLTIYSSCGSAEWLQWQLCHYTSIYRCNSSLKGSFSTIFLNQGFILYG